MGLKDRYQAAVTGAQLAPVPAAPPVMAAPPPTPTSVPATGPATSSGEPMAPVTGPSPPASNAAPGRDLAAVRARLAQRQSPGVNPPEAEIPATAFDRTTAEGGDGSLVLLDNHQDVLKAAAKAAVAGVAPAASTAGELTRGQKAAATRAANKALAAAGGTPMLSQQASTVAPVAAEEPSAVAPSNTAQLLAVLERIADALERIRDRP